MDEPCRNCGKPGGQAIHDDWDAVCPHCGQLLWLRPGDFTECKVASLTSFGIIVELGDGVRGVVHISELVGQRIRHPDEVVAVGDLIQAKVLRIDVTQRAIGLSRRRLVS